MPMFTPRGAFAALGLAVAVAATTFAAAPNASAAPAPRPRATSAAAAQPTPYPQYTLGPASEPTALTYPAFNSPAPGIGVGPTPPPDVAPQRVSLTEAIAIAYARSPALAAARADVGLQRAAKRLAQTGYLPNINASASTAHTNRQPGSNGTTLGTNGNGTTTGTNVDTGGFDSTTSNGFSFGLSQLIFDGFRVANQIRAASLSETAAADTYKRALQTVAFNVATAYYNQLASQRLTGVAVETVRLDEVQEDLVRSQIRAGTAARSDLSTAQLPTAQARVAVVRDQGGELGAQAIFANTLGLDANYNLLPVDDTPLNSVGNVSSIPVLGYDQALQRAYALRPDYASSQRVVESAEASLRAARAGYFPTLSGSATRGTASSDTVGSSYRNSNTVAATLNVPIFDSGITQANIDQARATIAIDAANLENVRQGVQLNVKTTIVNLISSRAALDEAQAEYSKANDVVRSTQAQYRAGVTTLPLLLNAQVGLTQALVDQVSSIYNLRQAEQSYLYAIGSNTP